MSHGLSTTGAGGALVTILRSAAYAAVDANAAATTAVVRTFLIASPFFCFRCSNPMAQVPGPSQREPHAVRTQTTPTRKNTHTRALTRKVKAQATAALL